MTLVSVPKSWSGPWGPRRWMPSWPRCPLQPNSWYTSAGELGSISLNATEIWDRMIETFASFRIRSLAIKRRESRTKRVICYPPSPPMDRRWWLPPLPIHNWAGEEAEAAAQRVQREDTEERELSTEGPWRPPRRHQVPFCWTGHQNWTSLSRHDTAPESSPFQLKKISKLEWMVIHFHFQSFENSKKEKLKIWKLIIKPCLPLTEGWLDFHPVILGQMDGNPTNPWWDFHPLDGFPSSGWNSIHTG